MANELKNMAVAAVAAPYTTGLSLIISPSARKLVKEFFGMDSEDNNTNKHLDE